MQSFSLWRKLDQRLAELREDVADLKSEFVRSMLPSAQPARLFKRKVSLLIPLHTNHLSGRPRGPPGSATVRAETPPFWVSRPRGIFFGRARVVPGPHSLR